MNEYKIIYSIYNLFTSDSITAIYIFDTMSTIYILAESSCRAILSKLSWSVHSHEGFNCSRKYLVTTYTTFLSVAGEKLVDSPSLQRT